MADQPSHPPDPTEPIRPRWPILLNFLFWITLLWMALGWMRFGQTLSQRELILAYVPAGIYWYLLLAGLLWGIAGFPLIWGLLRRTEWTLMVLWIVAVFYPLSYWIERLFLWEDPTGGRNWPFMSLLTLLWFGLVIWAYRSKRVRRFFEDKSIKESDKS